jgi:lysophospholipase L1-like esterase
MLFSTRQRILFMGDSITDCGRRDPANQPLGSGYVKLAANLIDARYGHLELTYINHGIGGNTAADLSARWQKECLDLNADWISILVGINDAHSFMNGNEKCNPENFRKTYQNLIQQVVEKSSAKIILWHPFYFVTPQSCLPKVADVIGQYIESVNSLASEFNGRITGVISTQELFAKSAQSRWIEFWIPEGVHPNSAGHAVMACEFLKFVGWEN